MKAIHLKSWKIEGDRVRLTYEDDTEFYVKKTDFDRAFGCIISGEKEPLCFPVFPFIHGSFRHRNKPIVKV